MLEIHGYRKTFNPGTASEVRALDGLDLSIDEGSFVVVIGTNGSGKSTLQNAIGGSFLPDAGSIHLAGKDITRWPEYRRSKLVGRVFQNPFSGTAPGMTIEENFALAARRGSFKGLGSALPRSIRSQLRDRVQSLKMGLEDRMDAEIGGLSGGQRQALTLLMATWIKPALLLLDEHTAALDPKSAERIIELTEAIIRESRLTAIMVTHSMSQAAHMGDRLVMMHRGRVIRDFAGAQKARLGVEDLLAHFEAVRRRDALDEGAAAMVRSAYV